MKKTRKFLALVLAFMVMMTFVGCSASDSGKSTTNTGDPSNLPVLKLGLLAPLTGVSSLFGGYMNTVGRAVIEEINKEGIKGFSKMEVKTYDTRSDQPTAVEQINRAKTEDRMNVIWGDWVEAFIVPTANNIQMPYVINNNTGLKILKNDVKWVINSDASSWDYGLAVGDFFKKNGVKTWAVTGQGWGEGWLDGWAEGAKYALKDTDIKNVWDKEVPADKVDWTSEINEWKKLKPDAVVLPYPGAGAYSVIKQMKDMGFWPKYVIVDSMFGGDYAVAKDALGKKYMMDLIAPTNADVESPAYKEFVKKELDLGYLPYGFSAEIWDTLHLIKVAAENAGPEGVKDPAKFMDALKKATYNGALGHPIGPFRENGLSEKVNISFVQVVDGAPDWTNKVDFHWKPIFKTEIPKQFSFEEANAIWPAFGKRVGQ